jgi:hypothetical protein
VIPLEILQKDEENKDSKQNNFVNYDKEKYKVMILDAAETVLGYFGFNSSVYENFRNNRKKRKWYYEPPEERAKDVQAETMT